MSIILAADRFEARRVRAAPEHEPVKPRIGSLDGPPLGIGYAFAIAFVFTLTLAWSAYCVWRAWHG